MSASVDHLVHQVLAPFAINTLDRIVPAVRQLVLILHESFLVNHQEPEPVIDVSVLIEPVRKIVLIVKDSTPEVHPDEETVIGSDEISRLLGEISRSIRDLVQSIYDTISALATI
ncbi:uncharacterized protein LOC128261350 [Drosophila gunungcola]|uniref:uncharacterized protein LOC128261350 n=1 Tax=Drosophila gunungcola TaxID=103775 RepID=UPI0022E65D52|nr:uncharacterized protein LOC128261350 [Drosophila gunungcola]